MAAAASIAAGYAAEPHRLPASGASPVVDVRVAEALESNAESPPPDAAPWRPIRLPDRWSHSRPAFGGTVWYRFSVRLDARPAQPWGVLLPRQSMNAEVWLNGALAGRRGRMDDPVSRHWYTPLLFSIPATAWTAGDNRVHLRVKAGPGHEGGLAPPSVGPTADLTPQHQRLTFWHVTATAVCNTFVIALGLFFLFIWLRRRSEAQFGYFALAAVLWGIAATNLTVTDPPMPDAAWELFVHLMQLWSLVLLSLFGLRYAGRPMPRVERGAALYAVVGAVAQLVLDDRWRTLLTAALLLPALGLGVWALIEVARHIRRQPVRDHILFGVAALLTVGCGVNDWLARAGMLPFEHPFVLQFAIPLVLAALAWLIAGEYTRTQVQLTRLNRDLAERVRQREAELRSSFDKLAEAQRVEATALERARILRDMHDGVGAHLTTALRQLEGGTAQAAEVAATLRDSLDQLKLSIDAMNLPAGDVNALLASLRYRLTPRIEAAGLKMLWDVEPLPQWSSGADQQAMRNLQFLLFEAFSNVLQHAHASEIEVAARADETGTIEIALADNGRGMPPGDGTSLRSIRARADLLGAELRIEGPGTRLQVRLPSGRS